MRRLLINGLILATIFGGYAAADYYVFDARSNTPVAMSAVSDGADATRGAKADAACGTSTGTCSMVAILKYIASVGLPVTNTIAALTVSTGQTAAPVATFSGASRYQAVAASQTATVLQSSTGVTGDYLSHCVIYPQSTSPGVVTVFDNTNTAANSAVLFAGGSTSTSNLTPISVPVGAVSLNGAWKVTTGANVSVVCYGKFS